MILRTEFPKFPLWAISGIDGKVISVASNHGNNDGHGPPSLFRHMIPGEADVNVIFDEKKKTIKACKSPQSVSR